MASPLKRTGTPGVYKRGGRYVAVWYDAEGRQRKKSARTFQAARRLKAERQADVARGEACEASRVRFAEYFREWVDRYHGQGRRGFRDNTRDEYRRLGSRFVLPFFGERVRLAEISPKRVSEYLAWLCQQPSDRGGTLSDSSVRNGFSPVRACLRTAVSEGLIRHNPATGISPPHRPVIEEEDGTEVRVLTREQLAMFLGIVDPRYRLMFSFLAATGLRISEAIALQQPQLHLDGSSPHVKVRRAYVKGRLQPPKSRHGKRDVPLDSQLVERLRRQCGDVDAVCGERLVFPNTVGTFLNQNNLRARVLKPVAQEVGAPWMGFHTLRHGCASLLFASGRNAVQVQKWLGHHSPSFTLDTYVHLLDGRLGAPLVLEEEVGDWPLSGEVESDLASLVAG